MNDYLSHLVATTLNQGEVLQPRLPARFESFRQRLGPVDVPAADLAQPEAAPVSYDAGTDIPVTFTEPQQGWVTSIAQEPASTPEPGALAMETAKRR